ncbi:DarT ssDNA thymidine ADP-ribosyltransferase family protein [Nocardia abscessus]|uniref:DarT ssDNA thymidine ADP-ribosyltransferase family protein n=1 Tax=Nocardia abscessus TaxID=120957 RepID=UPI003CC80C7C
MNISVAEALKKVPASRLIHFTPASNLEGIFRDKAIRSTSDLASNSADSYDPTDHRRFDNNHGHVCCSFEYPNTYYQNQASQKTEFVNYPDWVSLVLNIDLIKRPGAMFSPLNASKQNGAWLEEGGQAMLNCWASPSPGGKYPRRPTHNPAVPTDLQSEVQIPGTIPLSEVSAVVAPSEAQARSLFGFLHSFGYQPVHVEWRYAPMFFEPVRLRNAIWAGEPVPEYVWLPTAEDLA